MRIVIRAILIGAAIWDRFGAFHHEGAAGWAFFSGRLGFDRVFAGGIVGTAVEETKASAAFHHLALFADRTLNAG